MKPLITNVQNMNQFLAHMWYNEREVLEEFFCSLLIYNATGKNIVLDHHYFVSYNIDCKGYAGFNSDGTPANYM